MGSIIEFKHIYGQAVVDMSTIEQLSTVTAVEGPPCACSLNNNIYTFDYANDMNEVFEEVRTYMKENK